MYKKLTQILVGLFAAVCFGAAVPPAQAENNGGLDARQEAIVPIAAFAASGNMEKLKTALSQGLDAGLTVNEIKEILVQLYAYAGFPRSLNAIGTFMEVIEEREKKGIRDEMGKEAGAFPADKSRVVDKRVQNLRKAGIEVEYRKYKNAGHGFGLGTGTDAAGWIEHAILFWEEHL